MTSQPPVGPLDGESVKLLVKGDMLRCIKGSDESPAIATGEVAVSYTHLTLPTKRIV